MTNTKGITELAGGVTFDVKRDGGTKALLNRFREELHPELVKFLDQGQKTQWGVGLLFCNDSTIREPFHERRLLCARMPVRPGLEGLITRIVEDAKHTTQGYNLDCHPPYYDKEGATVSFILEASPEKVFDQLSEFAGIVNDAYRELATIDACAWKATKHSGRAYDDLVNAAADGKGTQDLVSAGNAWLGAQRNEKAVGREAAARVDTWASDRMGPEFRVRSARREDLLERAPKRSWSTEHTSQPRGEKPKAYPHEWAFKRMVGPSDNDFLDIFAVFMRRAGNRSDGSGE